MGNLLRADLYRMYRSRGFLLCLGAMAAAAMGLVLMQYTAMDYVVCLDRVIFLPMSFYCLAMAALISQFIGEDFSSGGIRSKLIACRGRGSVYGSLLITVWSACLTVFLLTTGLTLLVGSQLFPVNVTVPQVLEFSALGALMSLACGSIFTVVSVLIGSQTAATICCMALAFVMLFLGLHTNQILVQAPYRGGVPNPHYVSGIKRIVYGLLHDLNPTGQAAQLSTMSVFDPVRWILCDCAWILGSACVGSGLFRRKDIR